MNSENSNKIIKNIGVLMASQLTTWGLSLLLTIFLPRYLGPAASGTLGLAMALWLITSMFISFGLDMLLTKEIARKPTYINDLVGTSIFIQTILYCIGFAILMLYVQIVQYSSEINAIIVVIGISIFISQLALPMKSALEGLEKMGYLSVGTVASKVFVTVVTLMLLFAGQGLFIIAMVMIGAAFLELIIIIWYSIKAYYFRPRIDFKLTRWMLREGFPYLMVSMSQVLYAQVDMIVISLLVSTTVVLGWYGAAGQLFGTMLFIPAVFLRATFPAFSRLFTESGDQLTRLFRKSYDLLAILGVAIGIGIFIIAQPLVVLLFGEEFRESGPVLAIMGIVIIFLYQNMIMAQFLIVSDRQNEVTRAMFLAAGMTIVLDILLVPWTQRVYGNGAIGGSIAYLITESLMAVWFIYLLPKGVLTRSNFWLFMRSLVAGSVMLLVAWWFRSWFIAVPVIVGGLTFMLMTAVLRLLPQEDWIMLKQAMRKVIAKLPTRKTQAV